MSLNIGRLAGMVLKEMREYRRSPFIVGTMLVLPLVFLIEPIIIIFRLGASVHPAIVDRSVSATFLLLLITPVLIPAVLAAYSVVGEREQGTLEPLLTTPIRRDELLLGKALGVVVPAVAISYVVFGIVELSAHLFASNPEVVVALSQGPHVLAEFLFAPLLAGWSIWVGIGISTRASEVRVAQQLGTLASLPALGVVALVSFDVVTPSFTVAVAFALGLLAADVVMWRVVSAMFDRERLITGARALRDSSGDGHAARRGRVQRN
ncbi:MAG: ABC transporter permease subunit [Candidatus Dormiibacterota bacterium]